jgi:hypothetical protein
MREPLPGEDVEDWRPVQGRYSYRIQSLIGSTLDIQEGKRM